MGLGTSIFGDDEARVFSLTSTGHTFVCFSFQLKKRRDSSSLLISRATFDMASKLNLETEASFFFLNPLIDLLL